MSRKLLAALISIAAVSFAAVLVCRGIHKTCCEQLSTDELQHLQRSAEGGNVAAMKRLYFFFDYGEDPMNAMRWLKRAADAGDAEAEMLMYDRLLRSKKAGQRDLAVSYLRKAAEHGSDDAQMTLGKLYRDGTGVPRSFRDAEYWLRKGALSGDPDATLALCDLALLQGDKGQCVECIKLNVRAAATPEREGHPSDELARQRTRLERRLKELDRGSH